MRRRQLLASAAALPLMGCEGSAPSLQGGFSGVAHERGHLLRERRDWPPPAGTRKARVLIVGGGVAGLAAARALRLRGVDDYALLELEDAAGGNARAGTVQGIPCPLGAHYLPVPGESAPEVQDLLEELGLRQRVAGRWVYDERHLCHSPQERLYFQGAWQEGLLPLQGVGEGTLGQYRRFAALVRGMQKEARYTLPVPRGRAMAAHLRLDAITFETWLQQHGLDDQHLRWYLEYCCRDDYGAGAATVSAWAGIHYFASRHGFLAPGDANIGSGHEREGVLTWPQGNGWLTERLTAPIGDRLHLGRVVLRVAEMRHGVELDAWDMATQSVERWTAEHCVMALPVFVAARVVQNPPDFLRRAAVQTRYAPWLVANLHLKAPLLDRPGAAPSWDNVIYSEAPTTSLGYVDALHQSLQAVRGATVLTCYHALGDLPQGRQRLLEQSWETWREHIVSELLGPHPDLMQRATRLELTRYGHAMAVPAPGTLARLQALPLVQRQRAVLRTGRLSYAHSDWSGYSVFEEAFSQGHACGLTV